jgi:hypothetical protein
MIVENSISFLRAESASSEPPCRPRDRLTLRASNIPRQDRGEEA